MTRTIPISCKIWISVLGLYLFSSCFALVHAQSNTKLAIVVYSKEQSLSSLASELKKTLEAKLSSVNGFELVDVYSRLKGTGTRSPMNDHWDEVENLLERGRKSYDSLELKKAVSLLKKAESLVLSTPNKPFRMDVFTQVLIYLGASKVFLGKKAEGLRVFKTLLALNPKAKLDPMLFPPSLFSVFGKAYKELKKKPKGKILLDSDPSGANIWLDGRQMGLTPKRLSGLLPGRHTLRLVHSGYQDTGEMVELAAGAQKKIELSLDMLMGTAWLSSLLQRLNAGIGTSAYPDEVDQLLRKVAADRFVYLSISSRGAGVVRIRGYHWDGVSGRLLRSLDSELKPSSADFDAKLDEMFAALSMDPSASIPGEQNQEGLSNNDYGEPMQQDGQVDENSSSIWGAWWLWTAVGVVVVGAGLTAGLLLMDSGGSDPAQVIFRF